MMDEFEYSGIWWLPSHTDRHVAGSLTFTRTQGLRLSLIGSLDDPASTLNEFDTHEIILGVTQNGKVITLHDCTQISAGISFPGFACQSFLVKIGFVGAHFLDADQFRFYRASIQYPDLPEWVGLSGFNRITKEHEPNTIAITYTRPESIEAFIPSLGVLRIGFNCKSDEKRLRAMNIQQTTQLECEFSTDLTIDQLLSELVQPIGELLTLCTTRPNLAENINVFMVSGDSARRKITVIGLKTSPPQERLLIPGDMLFQLSDLGENFEKFLNRWFTIRSENYSTVWLFSQFQHGRHDMYLHHQFLVLVWSLETYHRQRNLRDRQVDQAIDSEAHNLRLEAILRNTPEEYQGWLTEKLQYSNRPTFRDRLREIIDLVNDLLSPVISNTNQFIDRIVNTRNYYVHNDRTFENGAILDTGELYVATQLLYFVMQALLLLELDFPLEQSIQLVQNTTMFKSVKSKTE
jgi:hypothetical protein